MANYQWSPTVLLMEVLRFPGMVVLWYSVLAARVPHVREVVRACYRQLLARPGLLVAAAAAPVVGLGWLALSRRERTVGALVADPLAQSLFAAAGLLAAAGPRPRADLDIRQSDTQARRRLPPQVGTLFGRISAIIGLHAPSRSRPTRSCAAHRRRAVPRWRTFPAAA